MKTTTTTTWKTRAQYTGGVIRQWTYDTLADAERSYVFLRDRASTDWVELYEVTTTSDEVLVDIFNREAP